MKNSSPIDSAPPRIPQSVHHMPRNNVTLAVAFARHHLEQGTWHGDMGSTLLMLQDDPTELTKLFLELGKEFPYDSEEEEFP